MCPNPSELLKDKNKGIKSPDRVGKPTRQTHVFGPKYQLTDRTLKQT